MDSNCKERQWGLSSFLPSRLLFHVLLLVRTKAAGRRGPEQRLQTCQSLDRKFKQTSCLPRDHQRSLWQRDGEKSSHRTLQFVSNPNICSGSEQDLEPCCQSCQARPLLARWQNRDPFRSAGSGPSHQLQSPPFHMTELPVIT